jgi:hypothetical protein
MMGQVKLRPARKKSLDPFQRRAKYAQARYLV